MRTWLYRIATNACLRALENRARRPLPSGLGAPAVDPDAPLAPARPEVPWLQPIPDARFWPVPADPAAVVVSRTSMRLALIAALQYLPPRQRAVLILRDVLGWRAAEVAELLGTSVPAVNSALQRAREHLAAARPVQDEIGEPDTAAERDLIGRYATAFENADMAGLVALLRADAVLEMPPLPGWFRGRDAVARFLGTRVMRMPCAGPGGPPRPPGEFLMVPTAANAQPALAGYQRDQAGVYHAHAIQVLTANESGLTRIVSFNDPGLFATFGLPDLIRNSNAAHPARGLHRGGFSGRSRSTSTGGTPIRCRCSG